MRRNAIKDKVYSFSVRIIILTKELIKRKVEVILINRLLKSGTSIAANVEEAFSGISKVGFSMKLSISYKEAKETGSWLKLLKNTGSISVDEYNSFHKDLDEILKVLQEILKKKKTKIEV
jgi:four helix bundle protein